MFLCSAVPQNVNGRTLRSLCGYLREKRPLLVSLPPRVPQDPNTVAYARLRTLRPDTLVHALLRITHTEMITGNTPQTRRLHHVDTHYIFHTHNIALSHAPRSPQLSLRLLNVSLLSAMHFV